MWVGTELSRFVKWHLAEEMASNRGARAYAEAGLRECELPDGTAKEKAKAIFDKVTQDKRDYDAWYRKIGPETAPIAMMTSISDPKTEKSDGLWC